MRWATALAALIAPSLLASEPIEYSIAFPNRAHHEAEVAIRVSALPEGPAKLHMSRSSPGRYALHEFVKNVYSVRATDGNDRPLAVTRDGTYRWTIAGGHDGTLTVRYTLFGDRCDGTYAAIDSNHAHLNMPATFAWIGGTEERAIRIRFRRPVPEWRVATQLLPTGDPEVFTAPDLDYFLDSPTEVSAHHVHSFHAGEGDNRQEIRLAVHHPGTPQAVVDYARAAEAVVREQIAIFGELPRFEGGRYTFIADYHPYASGDGMEHRNSTILTSSRPLEGNAAQLLLTLSHEFFHAWNVERIRPASIEPFRFERANPCGELWFAEGFTSYFDRLTAHRAGQLSLDALAASFGRTIERVLLSPATRYHSAVEMSLQAPLVDAATSIDRHNFVNTFLSYYTHGAAIALGLDLLLRTEHAPATLDAYLRAVWRKHGVEEIPYRNEDLERILGELTGDSTFAKRFFARFVYGREVIDYTPLLAAFGLELGRRHAGRAFIGFARLDAADDGLRVLSATRVGSPLYRAGVERGDTIVRAGGTSVKDPDALRDLVAERSPGDRIPIEFVQRGERRSGEIVLAEDPRLELVTFEARGKVLDADAAERREGWLGSRAPRRRRF